MEITVDGRVKVKDLFTDDIFKIIKQAFDMAFEPSENSFLDLETSKPQARNYQITQSEIDVMIEKAQVEIVELFGKCTLVAVQLANSFILTNSTTSRDPVNYNKDLNTQICLERIKKKNLGIRKLQISKFISGLITKAIDVKITGLFLK